MSSYKKTSVPKRASTYVSRDEIDEISDDMCFEIIYQLNNFNSFDYQTKNSILNKVQSIFQKYSKFIFENIDQMRIISNFIYNYIRNFNFEIHQFKNQQSENQQIVILESFLYFLADWFFSHNVKNEIFACDAWTVDFLLNMSICCPILKDKIPNLCLISLYNLIIDSQKMSNLLACRFNDELLAQFIQAIKFCNDEKMRKLIFLIFNHVYIHKVQPIDFSCVIQDIIIPLMQHFLYQLPNEVTKFVSLYFYIDKNKEKKKFYLNHFISQIQFDRLYQSMSEFEDERKSKALLFIRSLIDNNEDGWNGNNRIKIDFNMIIQCLNRNEKVLHKFFKLLISYFSVKGIFDYEYDYRNLFIFLEKQTDENFEIKKYILIIYSNIFLLKNSVSTFNPILSISHNVEKFMNFFFDFLECSDNDFLVENISRIILSILDLLPLSQNLIDFDLQKTKEIIQDGINKYHDIFDENTIDLIDQKIQDL